MRLITTSKRTAKSTFLTAGSTIHPQLSSGNDSVGGGALATRRVVNKPLPVEKGYSLVLPTASGNLRMLTEYPVAPPQKPKSRPVG